MSRVGASPEPVDQTNKTCSQQADGFIIPVNDRLTGFLAVLLSESFLATTAPVAAAPTGGK